jgi:hypothetical protein
MNLRMMISLQDKRNMLLEKKNNNQKKIADDWLMQLEKKNVNMKL